MKDLYNYSLLRHNTFGIAAECSRFIEVGTVGEACLLPSMLAGCDGPLLVLGGGSNLLLTGDFHGTVIHSAIKGMEHYVASDGSIMLRVGSGETWDYVVEVCVENGWHGAENLSLIPGEVGAVAVQNIGAYGAEASQIIHETEAVDIATGRRLTFAAADCGYGYRQSRFKKEWKGRYLITHVIFRLSPVFRPFLEYGNITEMLHSKSIDTPTPHQLRQAIIDIRRQKLPDVAVMGNAGSFFMNPVVERATFLHLKELYPDIPHYTLGDGREKIPAGWLIEQCGWKGRALGRAAVYDRQALVLVNLGGATGADIVALCQAIQHDVSRRFGIDIAPEVNIV